MTLSTSWPQNVERLVLKQVASTNDQAKAVALDGGGPAWVLALDQTASRGRRGRAWSFQEGNFAASYLSWPGRPVAELAQMSFVAALALRDTVAACGVSTGLSFKWPNDLLVGGRKLSGILLETVLLSGRNALVTGIGVNLVHSPDPKKLEDRAVAPIALAEMSEHLIEPTAFLDMLAPIMDQWERKWLADGFAPIRQSWLDHAIGVGEPIVARLADRELSGTYEMIDAHGSLILSNRAGRHVVPAAEIYFPTSERIKGVREVADVTRS